MSHFNRWWSKQHKDDPLLKVFASVVWQESSKPYLKTIDAQSKEIAKLKEEIERLKTDTDYNMIRDMYDEVRQQLDERDEIYKAVCTELAAYMVATLNLKEKLAEKTAECEELKAELTKYKKGHDDWQDIRNQGIAEGRREMIALIEDKQYTFGKDILKHAYQLAGIEELK